MKHLFFFTIVISLLATSFSSCGDDSKYPGYSEADSGIYYKLHVPGESGKKAGPDDFYEVRMLNSYGGVAFYDSDMENGRGTLFMQSSASRYFSVLGEGDSATFLLPGGDLRLPGTPDTGMVEMNVKIVRILTAGEMQQLEKDADPDVDEQLLIRRYLAKHGITATPDNSGLYFISLKEGTGLQPSAGKTVQVRYSGTLFNGHLFDAGGAGEEAPFSFTWGQEGQMLPGVITALSRMKAGGKAKIILPSPLAFGTDGSTAGVIPPHTPVVYELELVSVE